MAPAASPTTTPATASSPSARLRACASSPARAAASSPTRGLPGPARRGQGLLPPGGHLRRQVPAPVRAHRRRHQGTGGGGHPADPARRPLRRHRPGLLHPALGRSSDPAALPPAQGDDEGRDPRLHPPARGGRRPGDPRRLRRHRDHQLHGLPAGQFQLPLHQPAHRRIRRLDRKPRPLHARAHRRHQAGDTGQSAGGAPERRRADGQVGRQHARTNASN